MDLLQLCKEMIAINSVTIPNGTREMVHFLSPIFEKLGLRVKTQEFLIEGHQNLNLLASLGPQSGDAPLLINTHLDTVSPGDQRAWTKCSGNPFQATLHDDFLYGLGVADTKLALACVIQALQVLEKPLRQPLHILATAGEEHGLLGAHHAMQTQWVQAKYALDSEPSELNLVWAHKGLCATTIHFIPKKKFKLPKEKIFATHFSGEAAHSSTPKMGKNALDLAFAFLRNLSSKGNAALHPCHLEGGSAPNVIPAKAVLYFFGDDAKTLQDLSPVEADPGEKASFLPADVFYAATAFHQEIQALHTDLHTKENPDFDPPTATTATTQTGNLSDPPGLSLLQDLRFINPEDGKEFYAHLKIIGKRIEQKFPDVEITVNLVRHNEPLFGRKESPFVENLAKMLQAIGLPGKRITKAGCTEGALFAKAGMETIVIGPGAALNNIHKPNEKVALTQLQQASVFYQRVIERLCS